MKRALALVLCITVVLVVLGCDGNKGRSLKVISPHNNTIKEEFETAFAAHCREKLGKDVTIEWLDVGGGGSKIVSYLRNVYKNADTAQVDIVWGGGDDAFDDLAEDGVLQPVTIPDDFKQNVPPEFAGVPMYRKDGLWVGTAVSGFGILYNKVRLEKMRVAPPALWDDLADKRFFNRVALADPAKSSSAAACYKMIVQSSPNWESGWAKLLAVLGNARRFYDGASSAAEAVKSEAPVATCIDFYGAIRCNQLPDRLVYVSPQRQTVFNADPIAILKNPPNAKLARAFVDFVLTANAQALWALPAGADGGPKKQALFRTPIRRDVFTKFEGRLAPGIEMPFQAGNEMSIEPGMERINFSVFKRLVHAAGPANAAGLKRARKMLIDKHFETERWIDFNTLPDNLKTIDQFAEVAKTLDDEKKSEALTTDWIRFFREKYERVAR